MKILEVVLQENSICYLSGYLSTRYWTREGLLPRVGGEESEVEGASQPGFLTLLVPWALACHPCPSVIACSVSFRQIS